MRRIGPDFGGRAVLDVTDIQVRQVNAVDPQVELLGLSRRNVEPELFAVQEGAHFVRVPAAKDALSLQQRVDAEARHLTSASLQGGGNDSTRRARRPPRNSCSFWI